VLLACQHWSTQWLKVNIFVGERCIVARRISFKRARQQYCLWVTASDAPAPKGVWWEAHATTRQWLRGGQGRTFVARARSLIDQEATAALKAAQNRVIAFSAVNNPAGLAWGSSGGPLEVVDVSNV
jgi:hypothetical protein